MRLWHVTYTSHGFNLFAVVVAAERGAAIAALKLGEDCGDVEAIAIGYPILPTARVVCESKLEIA